MVCLTHLEVVNQDKIREEWQDVFNLEQITLSQILHSTSSEKNNKMLSSVYRISSILHLRLDILVFLHNMASNAEPKFLSQSIIVLRFVGIDPCEFQIVVLVN